MEWSSWLDLRLRLLWAKREVPMMDLCERLGRLERDVVLKRADELGLGTRPEQAQPQVATPAVATEDLEIVIPRRCTLLELEYGRCRWPVGDPDEAGFFFCNAEALPLKPYCGPHCQRAYRKPWDREDYIP